MLQTVINNVSSIFDNYNQAVILTDNEGKIHYWNAKAEQIYGWTFEEVNQQYILDVIKPADFPQKINSAFDDLKKGISTTNNWNFIRKNKSIVNVSVTSSPLVDKSGEVIGMMGISHENVEYVKREDVINFLSESSEILISTLNYDEALKNIAELIVPRLADWFVVDIYNEKINNFDMIMCHHVDKEKILWAKELRVKYPIDITTPSGGPQVFRSGVSELYKEITPEMLDAAAKDSEQRAILEKVGYKSIIILPLKGRDKIIGTITLVLTTESNRTYEEFHIKVMEEFARKLALTMENLKLYKQVKETQERMDNILDTIPCVVYESNGRLAEGDQKVFFVNKYTKELFGYSPEEFLNSLNIGIKVIHPDDKERIAIEMKKIIEKGEGGELSYRAITKHNSQKWVHSKFKVIKDENNNTLGIRGVVFDQTLYKELEQKKDEFISIASHELKTPLAIASGFLQLIQVEEDTSNLKLYVNKAREQLNTLNEFIGDLLDLSKIQQGKLNFKFQNDALYPLLMDTVEYFKKYSLSHKINISGSLNGIYNIDKQRMQQVFNNLISNAIKYSPDADTIDITLSEDDSKGFISIKDYGMGISEEHLKHIFDKFYRVDEESQSFSGLGIGLFISNEIINGHKGKILVNSELGKGTEFIIEIPK